MKKTLDLPQWLRGKESACNSGDLGDTVRYLGQEDALEEEMATQSSILAWEIPWTEELGGLQLVAKKFDMTQLLNNNGKYFHTSPATR